MARGLYAALTALFLIMCGCGGGGSSSSNATLSTIRVTPSSSKIAIGSTTQFRATGTYSDGSVADITDSATWSSSNAPVGTVSNASGTKGVATAVSAGSATITASFQGVSGTATLTSAQVLSIAVTPASPQALIVGSTQPFTATATLAGGGTQNVTSNATWSSSNTTAASISNTAGSRGVVTGRTAGTTDVTATFDSVTSAAVPLVVVTVTTITVSPTAPDVFVGSNQQFTAFGDLSNGERRDITSRVAWRSGNTALLTINASGSASAVSPGDTSVSATFSAVTGSTTVHIVGPDTITVTPANATVVAGGTQQFTATGTFPGGSTRNLTTLVNWSSSSTSVASISNSGASKGLATGVAQGSTQISAALGGTVSTPASMTVNVLRTLVITPSTASIPVGSTRQLRATATFTDNTTADLTDSVTWSSSAPSIASVSNVTGSKGLVSANVIGNATISAQLGNVTTATSAVAVTSGTVVTVRNKALVSNFGSNTVSVIDTDANQRSGNAIPVGIGPQGIAINGATNRAYVANSGDGTVSVIDITNNVVVDTISLGGSPWNLAVNPVTNRLYVANSQTNSVFVINTTTGQIVINIPVSANPKGIAVNTATNRVYVTNFGNNTVSVIDATTNKVVNLAVPTGSGPFDVAVNAAANTYYVTNSLSSTLFVFDGGTDSFTTNIGVGVSSRVIAINPASGRAYVALHDGNTVAIVNTATNSFIENIGVGAGPIGVAVDPSANRLYVANNGGNDIWVFDTTTSTPNLVAQITGFIGPTYIAVVP